MIKFKSLFFSFFILVLLVQLVGCGERIGPSDAKVALDFNDHIIKQFQTVILVKSFNVDNVHQLSEDRIDIDVTFSLQMDPTIEDKINRYRDPYGGYSSHPLKRFWRKASRLNMGQDEYVTIHYRLNENAIWVVQSMTPRQP